MCLHIPSSGPRTTSEGISRIFEVIGATVTSLRNEMAELRVRIKTGRFLSVAPYVDSNQHCNII